MTTLFSTREYATAIVFVFFLICVCYLNYKVGKLSNSLKQFVKCGTTLFCTKLSFIIFAAIAYISLLVYILSDLPNWDGIYYKEIIIWFLFCGVISAFKAFEYKSNSDLWLIVKDNLKWSVVLNFILSTVTFCLCVEIMISLIASLLIFSYAISKKEAELFLMQRFCKISYNILFVAIVLITFYEILNNFSYYLKVDLMILFILPIILSILFIPLLYAIALYVLFETLFMRVKIATKSQCSQSQYLRIIIYSKLSIKKINLFTPNYLPSLFLEQTPERLESVLEFYKKGKKCTFGEIKDD